jgi:hypothetical protein
MAEQQLPVMTKIKRAIGDSRITPLFAQMITQRKDIS